MLRALLLALAAVALALAPAPCLAKNPDHVGAAAGGAVAGLVCGGGTIVYAQLRTGGQSKPDDPILWHQAQGPAILGAFFVEHGAVGGLTGAIGDGPRAGFIIGGAVTCTLDVAWIITSEVIAANSEPSIALVQHDRAGWRLGVPPVAVRRDGAAVELFAMRF